MDKRVLLIIGGGIAAYKSLDLIRLLLARGVKTRAILTRAGAEFVTPLSVSALSGQTVHQDLFALNEDGDMGHIELSRAADLVVVCPATADLMAKAAGGHANDLASTALLATDKPVLMAPAMNVRMWLHPATQRNVARLREDGVTILEPDVGAMACGEFGPGRLPHPEHIVDAILGQLGSNRPEQTLKGLRAIVTAGPTREPLDAVRFLSNHSSGKQGYAIATALAERGAQVSLISGPTSLSAPPSMTVVQVETANEMLDAVLKRLPADIFVSVAAVADWRPVTRASGKLKLKNPDRTGLTLKLTENPDILRHISNLGEDRPRLVIGFAAETQNVEAYAAAKLARKGCDWIVANDVSGDVMGGAENEITLLQTGAVERWRRMTKEEVAQKLADRIGNAMAQSGGKVSSRRSRTKTKKS
ncbi:MAG: bifunctional phosphopantothenoylcysteine decarboxylase/phosphopantothenate--cysteine ligase CoaBC [Alphaproteobacteria bacterium]|nr:bifunctional phosphopantothenoylcysteine decarboxylase/phosphopantothenate--cysteine ligase CoaBC [Alphaproteobacteria bacterium]